MFVGGSSHLFIGMSHWGLQWSLTADTPGSLPEEEADKGMKYAFGTLVPVSAGHSPQEHAFPGHSDTTPVV